MGCGRLVTVDGQLLRGRNEANQDEFQPVRMFCLLVLVRLLLKDQFRQSNRTLEEEWMFNQLDCGLWVSAKAKVKGYS